MGAYAKAIIAFLAALASGLGLVADNGFTLAEVLSALGTAAVTSGLVYRVRNTDPEPASEPSSQSPDAYSPEYGYSKTSSPFNYGYATTSGGSSNTSGSSSTSGAGNAGSVIRTRPLPSKVPVKQSTGVDGSFTEVYSPPVVIGDAGGAAGSCDSGSSGSDGGSAGCDAGGF